MKTLIVACVQQKMRLPQTLEEYREDLRRFLRAAANKRARLVIFPELAGVMVMPSLLGGFQANLLKRADLARRRQSSLWQKINGGLCGALAGWLDTDFRQMAGALLATQPEMVWDAYDDVFGGLAQEFDVTLVAPSAYLPDPVDGLLRNLAVVYGPGGERLGYQAKRILHPEDEDLAQPGDEWNVIPTPVGQIGLMLGGDVLYPEVGRLLAYQGAEMLIGQGAATDRVLYEKLRSGMLARMQDNQLFAAISFLVGHNEFSRRQRDPFVGRSSVFAPQELTPRSSGVLVEASNFRSESVLSAVWDFPALAELWETSDTPVRSRLPLETVGPALAQLYQQMQQLPKGAEIKSLPAPKPETRSLDELPVLASVMSYWPLPADEPAADEQAMGGAHAEDADPVQNADDLPAAKCASGMTSATGKHTGESTAEDGESEEETQEMDALPGPEEAPAAEEKQEDADREA